MLSKKVLEWLNSTGFPLEMEAANEFRKAGFDVRQSSTFSDPQSDKGREIDVLASDPDYIGIIEISFVIECKSSAKPWVILMSDDTFSNYNSLFAFCVNNLAAREGMSSRIIKQTALKNLILRQTSRGGYGFRQALGKEADPAYTAAMSTIKACYGITQDRVDSSTPRLSFAFPVIVVDSPLFECSRSDDGELELTEVTHSEFLFAAHIPEYVGCSIKVITRHYLPEYAKWAKQMANTLREELKAEEKES